MKSWTKEQKAEARSNGLGLVKITLQGRHIEGHGILSETSFACDEVAFQAIDDLVRDVAVLGTFQARGRWISLKRTDSQGRPILCCQSCGRTRTVDGSEDCDNFQVDCDEWEPENAYR